MTRSLVRTTVENAPRIRGMTSDDRVLDALGGWSASSAAMISSPTSS
jgi:hypothetical protein